MIAALFGGSIDLSGLMGDAGGGYYYGMDGGSAAISMIPPWLVLLGLGFSTLVGVLSGLSPAHPRHQDQRAGGHPARVIFPKEQNTKQKLRSAMHPEAFLCSERKCGSITGHHQGVARLYAGVPVGMMVWPSRCTITTSVPGAGVVPAIACRTACGGDSYLLQSQVCPVLKFPGGND